MKRGRWVFVFMFILVLSMSFASAGLFDWFKKTESVTITGNVIDYTQFNNCEDCMANEGKWCIDIDGYYGDRCIDSLSNCPSPYFDTVTSCYVAPYCGDETCNEDEDCEICPGDCGCESGFECVNAECVEEEEYCVDSDGGKDYYKKGTLNDSYYFREGEQKLFEDSCAYQTIDMDSSVSYVFNPVSGPFLAEYSCNNHQGADFYECPNGCVDGACVEEPVVEDCYDSDGNDYYHKGKVYYQNQSFSDGCLQIGGDLANPILSGEVVEMSCFDGKLESENYMCPNGCVDGACVGKFEGCYDSDGGENISQKGSLIYEGDLFEPDTSYFELLSDSSGVLKLEDKELKVVEGESYSYRGIEFNVVKIEPGFYDTGEDMIELKVVGLNDVCLGDSLIEWYCDSGRAYVGELDEPSILLWLSEEKIEEESFTISCPNSCVDGACVEEEQRSYCENGKCTLYEGDGVHFENYKVETAFIDEPYVKLSVNGINLDLLSELESMKVDEDLTIKILNIYQSSKEGVSSYVVFEYEIEEPLVCSDGCILGDECVPVCYRKKGDYCALGGELKTQLAEGEACDNSCECDSNVCAGGECVSGNIIQKVLNWFKRIFGVQNNDDISNEESSVEESNVGDQSDFSKPLELVDDEIYMGDDKVILESNSSIEKEVVSNLKSSSIITYDYHTGSNIVVSNRRFMVVTEGNSGRGYDICLVSDHKWELCPDETPSDFRIKGKI